MSSTLLTRLAVYVAALLFAALAATVGAFALGMLPPSFAPVVYGVALAHAVFLGLPFFLFLKSRRRVSGLTSICAGFVIGVVPAAILFWSLDGQGNAWVGGTPTVIDGAPTAAGWILYAGFLLLPGLLGACAGLAFWATLNLSGMFGAAEADNDRAATPRSVGARGTGLAAAAVLLAGAVFAIPYITKDRTCHNMFRDGRTGGIASQVHMDLYLSVEEWPKLTKLLENFGSSHELSVRDESQPQDETMRSISISLCNERGVNVLALEYRLVSENFAPAVPGQGVPISVYEVYPDSGWQGIARDLVADIESTWPGQIQFRGDHGQAIPMPKELLAN